MLEQEDSILDLAFQAFACELYLADSRIYLRHIQSSFSDWYCKIQLGSLQTQLIKYGLVKLSPPLKVLKSP